MKAIIGTKVGMTQIQLDENTVKAVTLIRVEPHTVTQVKTAESDGYSATQVGTHKNTKQGKSKLGHVKASKATPELLREFPVEGKSVGDSFDVSEFTEGDKVSVTGTSKGKGFAGTIKRHNFARGPKTHGSRNYREPGSIGSMYPQKIFKGKRMAGQMGGDQVTVKNITVGLVDAENGILGLVGAVPGPNKGIVTVRGEA